MSAHGEWKFDFGYDNYDSYIDYSRIKTEGRYKSMWDLEDLKSPKTGSSGKVHKSSISKSLIDCQSSRIYLIAIYYYSEQMGKGGVVDSANYQIKESDWKYPPPNSLGEGFIKIACAINSNPKPPISNTQDIKRQRCISLGLAPNSADFQQCMK
jgi:hypothetical protein